MFLVVLSYVFVVKWILLIILLDIFHVLIHYGFYILILLVLVWAIIYFCVCLKVISQYSVQLSTSNYFDNSHFISFHFLMFSYQGNLLAYVWFHFKGTKIHPSKICRIDYYMFGCFLVRLIWIQNWYYIGNCNFLSF